MLRSLHRIDKIRNVLARRQPDLTVVLRMCMIPTT